MKPVHSLRNLILGLEVQCDHFDRGCKSVVKLDVMKTHTSTCPFAPVECAGCNEAVSRHDLADHQMTCPEIAATVVDDELEETPDHFGWAWRTTANLNKSTKSACCTDVMCRIRVLEMRVQRLLEDLRSTRTTNLTLEMEYRKISTLLYEKHREILEFQNADFFLEHECARTPETIAKLSLFLARNLLKKPRYIDEEKVFSAIRKCYDKFHGTRPECDHDLHMLLATAYASNWFTSASQRLTIKRWLHAIARLSIHLTLNDVIF